MPRVSPHLRALGLAALLAQAACAAAPPRPPRAEVLWPAGGEPARVRLAAVLPDPDAPPPRPPLWRRVLDFLVGRDPERPEDMISRPFGVATVAGAVYVADPDVPAVLRLAGREVQRITCPDLDWAAPMAVAAAPDGTLFVADGGNGTVVVVQPAGPCHPIGAGELERPVSVAVDGDRILVADPPRHQVVVLARDGRVLARWGAEGEGPNELHFPTGVARAADGTILVVDAMNFRVVRLSASGEWLGAFGAAGETGGGLAAPKAVATDADGRVFVTDARRDLVLVFAANGELEYTIGETGDAPGHLAHPAGIAVAGSRVFVVDSMNRRVQVFEILGDRT
jgi:DNA-binding beta-propeller fold protein YncE